MELSDTTMFENAFLEGAGYLIYGFEVGFIVFFDAWADNVGLASGFQVFVDKGVHEWSIGRGYNFGLDLFAAGG